MHEGAGTWGWQKWLSPLKDLVALGTQCLMRRKKNITVTAGLGLKEEGVQGLIWPLTSQWWCSVPSLSCRENPG